MRRALAIAIACVAVMASPAFARGGSLPLPSRADAAPLTGAQSVFGPPPGQFPSKAPGPVSNDETVHVALDESGVADAISVDQTLRVTGVGDFTLEITGPASAVRAAPGTDLQPGLRNGSVIWEGFSAHERTLRSTVTIDMSRPRFLGPPLRVSVRMAQGGVATTAPRPGPVTVTIGIANVTGGARTIYRGAVEASALRAATARVRASLARGRAPYAGEQGIPASFSTAGSGAATTALVQVPMLVDGTVTFGGAVHRIAALLPSPAHPDGTMSVRLDATAPANPSVFLNARAALPAAGALDAPLANGGFERLQTVLWQVLRMPEYEAFLGSPLGGPSSARFEFETAPPPVIAPKTVRHVERAHPLRIAIVIALLLAFAAAAARLWQRS